MIRQWRFGLLGLGLAVALGLGGLMINRAIAQTPQEHYLAANADTVHWGYFSQSLEPKLTINSGDIVTVETLTHHANDDASLMVMGDPGAESVFAWTPEGKGVDRRGAGSTDPEVYTTGAGEGAGVHVLTGPIYINGAEPGDVLEVKILDVAPRPSGNPEYQGRTFGSNAAAWWGFHYNDMIEDPKPREVITIYELDATEAEDYATALYNFRWTPQTDPFGVVHETIDYPGVPVDPATIDKNYEVLEGVKVPIRPHFGLIGLAPREADFVDSVPPSYFGGNIDNWRIGEGATMYYPIAVEGALLSLGDPHAAQGDSELAGTAIETSLTGKIQVTVHKQSDLAGTILEDLYYPLLENDEEYVVHGFSYANYLEELGDTAQKDIFGQSSIDKAMRDAFHKMRHFLMTTQGMGEDEAISLMSVATDFGVTQIVDGNWGVHGVIKKAVLPGV
ncbi:acetamidase/formamidase family protein [Phormidium tenue]|uniref:Acetamidase n=1 Tax=Phormidium tenue NIES-30 TaxID=549789 RepID=A0A1U7J177_9CYAN|nr:acetamidase/formamidase family protein [Phormidium tenue]MBD2233961.1 acetamidase/formamidase family protein [Phormidium tenue FACHB-1052]OKH45428.1 acetamidase [Phormidium tenue NIES-30]